MNEVFKVKATGETVKEGDFFSYEFKSTKKDGTVIHGHVAQTLTEERIKSLIKKGILETETFIHTDLPYYVGKVVGKLIKGTHDCAKVLGNIIDKYPIALLSCLLKEIAIEFDHKYEGTINKCATVWVISTLNGNVHCVKREHIKNFRNFAAFRTEEDAKLAKKILKDFFSICFCGCK